MTAIPKLEPKNVEYTLDTAERIVKTTRERRAGSVGEKQAQHILLNELKKYCDETKQEIFKTHPGAGTIAEKLLCVLLVVCVFVFTASVNNGNAVSASIVLFTSLIIFCVFCYKFIFDGKKLDFITPSKTSANLLGIRYSRGETQSRVVLVSRSDSPQCLRTYKLGNKAQYILSLASIIGNTCLFVSALFFLFSGAPEGTPVFKALSGICFMFVPFYVISVFHINSKRVASGIGTSVIPSSVLLSVLKQLHENSFRYDKTELCCLITGSDYSSRAGAYAFADKYKRLYRDVPTIFIPIEEITSSKKLSVFFRDGSGTTGSEEIATTIREAGANLGLKIKYGSHLLGSGAFTPFTKNHFPACSLGTSKDCTSKCFLVNGEKLSDISKKSVADIGSLIIETLNYFDG